MLTWRVWSRDSEAYTTRTVIRSDHVDVGVDVGVDAGGLAEAGVEV